MNVPTLSKTFFILIALGCSHALCQAKTIINNSFSKGTFTKLGWKPAGQWDIFKYKASKHNPGWVARFSANTPSAGTLTKKFLAVKNPKHLTLSVDLGWGWGNANQGSDAAGFMLLNSNGNGYAFAVHRTIATWAVQWAKVTNDVPPATWNWAPKSINATIKPILSGGGLQHVVVTRNAAGKWTFSSKHWNTGKGAKVAFRDNTTKSFSKIVLFGWKNFDDECYNHITLMVAK